MAGSPALLLDENVPRASVAKLRLRGRDVVWVAESSAGITDEAVLQRAATESRWLFTFDRDYGELVFRRRLLLPPAIVLLRVRHYSPTDPADWIDQILSSEKSSEGGFFVFDDRGLRWRPLRMSRP